MLLRGISGKNRKAVPDDSGTACRSGETRTHDLLHPMQARLANCATPRTSKERFRFV